MTLGDDALPPGEPTLRAYRGIARTFQTPRVIGEASVLQNVMIGGTIDGRASFVESMLALPRNRRMSAMLRGQGARRCSASSGSKCWPTSVPTVCSTANCASSRSPAR